jgi:hypothetical protein
MRADTKLHGEYLLASSPGSAAEASIGVTCALHHALPSKTWIYSTLREIVSGFCTGLLESELVSVLQPTSIHFATGAAVDSLDRGARL